MTTYPAGRTITEQWERIPRPVPTAICDLLHSPSRSPRTRPGENNCLALEEVTLAEPGLTTCPSCLWLWGCINSKTQGPAQIFSETKKVIIALKQGRTGRTSAAQGQRQGCESTVLEKGPFARETEDAEFYISRHRRPQLGEGGHESS